MDNLSLAMGAHAAFLQQGGAGSVFSFAMVKVLEVVCGTTGRGSGGSGCKAAQQVAAGAGSGRVLCLMLLLHSSAGLLSVTGCSAAQAPD